MSVDKVQTPPPGFTEWVAKQPEDIQNMSEKKQLRLFKKDMKKTEKPDNESIPGTEIEKSNDVPLTEEAKAQKEAAKAKENAEVAAQKEAAAKYYRPTEELTEIEQAYVDKAVETSGKDKPLYKSKKAQKALKEDLKDTYSTAVEKFYDELIAEETDTTKKAALEKDKEKALKEKNVKKAAKVWSQDITTGDRVENTIMFDTRKEKREARRELREAGETDYRLRVHNKKINSDNNQELQLTKQNLNIGSHETIYEYSKDISGDREYDPNEVGNMAAKSGDGDNLAAVKQELRRLGYKVKDDTLVNVAKGLGVAVASGLAANAFPKVVTAFAEAIAQVTNEVTGEILAQKIETDSDTKIAFNEKGGALAGVVAGALAVAIFGETKDENMLNDIGVEELFKDNEKTGKRAYETMEFGKHEEQVKLVLRAIDSLEATDAQKTELLKQSAGKESQHILSSKELALALLKAAYAKEDPSLIPEDPNKCPDCPECPECDDDDATDVDDVNPTTPPAQDSDTPEYKIEYTEKDETRSEYTQTGLRHKSGLYADTIVRKGYIREDGGTMNEKQIKEVRDIIQKDNRVNKLRKVPNIWILNNEIELSDGTKVKLRPEDELNQIQPEKSEASDIGLYSQDKQPAQKTIQFTNHGYKITEKQPDGSEKVVAQGDGFTNIQEAQQAAETKLKELEAE